MRRITFYLIIAVLAFSLGIITVSKLYLTTNEKTVNAEIEVTAKVVKSEKNIGRGSGTGHRTSQKNDPVYVPKLHKPTCSNKKMLPIWNVLRKDKKFQEYSKDFYMNADCSEMLDIQKTDLNNDGRKEIIIWGSNGNLCGGTGNCVVWIYEKKNGAYKKFLHGNAYNDGTDKWFELKKSKNNGYQDFILKSHFSGYETIVYFYKFNGKKYEESKCLFEDYSLNEKVPFVETCEQAWRRQNKRLQE